MGFNGHRKVIVLYVIVLIFAESVLGNEPLKSNVSENEKATVPLQIQQNDFSEKDQVANSEKGKTTTDDVETPVQNSSPLRDDVDYNSQMMLKKLGIDIEKSASTGSKAEKNARMLAQSDMRHLSRFLQNFRGRQIFIANDEDGFARKASSVSNDDEDAIAEERAIRRRQRIRRRKIYSNVGQPQRNSNNPSRKKTSHRQNSDVSYSRRKGSNVRGGYVRNPLRRSGNKNAYRKGNKKQPNRKQSNQKRKKNKTNNKKNKNKNNNKNKKPQKHSSKDSNSASQQDQSAETQENQQSSA